MTTEEKYGKLILLRNTKDRNKNLIDELTEKYITPLKNAQLKLEEEEDKLSATIIADMENRNIKTYEYNDKNIIRSERVTPQLIEPILALEEMYTYKDKIKKLITVPWKEFEKSLIIVTETVNKKVILDIADSLKKVEGVELKGVESKVTKYLTIK